MTPSAHATFPGKNGPIAYRHVDSGTGLGTPLFVARPDGSHSISIDTRPGFFTDWRADGRRIAMSPNGDIQAIRPNGRRYHTVLAASAGHGYHKPSFSPDGTRIVSMYENQGTLLERPPDYNEDICTMRADGTHVVKLTNSPEVLDNYPSWGPAPTL
jgi:Tol biopolymer transport system component